MSMQLSTAGKAIIGTNKSTNFSGLFVLPHYAKRLGGRTVFNHRTYEGIFKKNQTLHVGNLFPGGCFVHLESPIHRFPKVVDAHRIDRAGLSYNGTQGRGDHNTILLLI
jgi:hypothetical protein